MLRTRMIRPGFFSNEFLAQLQPLARILFEGLWCVADREGRLEDRPMRLKASLLPYDDCDTDELLQSLADIRAPGEDVGFIVRYEINGRRFIQVTNFLVHQGPHHKEAPSTIPAPPNWLTTPGTRQLLLDETSEQAQIMLEPSLNQGCAEHDLSLNGSVADVGSTKSSLVPLVTSPSPLTSYLLPDTRETTSRASARKPQAKKKKPEETLVFTDDESRVMDAVRAVFAEFDFFPEPSWWRRIGFVNYTELNMEAEAFKQAAWLRENRKRNCSLTRYTNWLDKAVDDLATRSTRTNGHTGMSRNTSRSTNGKVHLGDVARDEKVIPWTEAPLGVESAEPEAVLGAKSTADGDDLYDAFDMIDDPVGEGIAF